MIHLPVISRSLDWVHMASALNWDPFCLPSKRLVREAGAIASYMGLEKPDCVLPSLPRPQVATLLARHISAEHPPIIPIVHNLVSPLSTQAQAPASGWKRVAFYRGVPGYFRQSGGHHQGSAQQSHDYIQSRGHTASSWQDGGASEASLAAGRPRAGHFSRRDDWNIRRITPTLIKAFARLTARRSCRLIILGEGRRRKELEGLVKELKLAGRISLPGWVENPFAFMYRASLFVLSSRHEGLPTVLVEALACGCPCVSTDCRAGPAEILKDGKFGALVPGWRRGRIGGCHGTGSRSSAGETNVAREGRGFLRRKGD